jgi:hypothetical protein
MTWIECIQHAWEELEKPEGQRSIGRLRHRSENNIKIDLEET